MLASKTAKSIFYVLAITTSLPLAYAPAACAQLTSETQGDVQKVFLEPQVNQMKFSKQTGAVVGKLQPLPNGLPSRIQYSPLWDLTTGQRVFLAIIYLGFLLGSITWYILGLRFLASGHRWERV